MKPETKIQSAPLSELVALYESDEHKALIDLNHWSKPCTAGTEDNSLIDGCRQTKPLYDFPLIVQYKKNVHAYAPDQDGVLRRNICKDCLREYNKLTQQKRRSKVFTKQEALSQLERYIKSRLKTKPALSPTYLIVKAENNNQYTFNELEKLKQDAKRELI